MKNRPRLQWKQLQREQRVAFVMMTCVLLVMTCALLLIVVGFLSLFTNIYLFLIVFDVVGGTIIALGVIMMVLAIANHKNAREKSNEQEQQTNL